MSALINCQSPLKIMSAAHTINARGYQRTGRGYATAAPGLARGGKLCACPLAPVVESQETITKSISRGVQTEYGDIPGFCRSETLDEIRKHGHVLTPGRYVGAKVREDDGEPFEEKMARLVAQLREQQADAARLEAAILKNLRELGFL